MEKVKEVVDFVIIMGIVVFAMAQLIGFNGIAMATMASMIG